MSSKNPEAICCASYEAFKAFKAAILQDSCGARNGFLTRYRPHNCGFQELPGMASRRDEFRCNLGAGQPGILELRHVTILFMNLLEQRKSYMI